MEKEERFRFYGEYNIDNLKKIISDNNLDWERMKTRQKACHEMRATQTIPLVYDPNFMTTNYIPQYWDYYELFEKELKNISEIIFRITEGKGYLLRAIIVKLMKNSSIPTHVDFANETLKYSRRIHLPIVTNDKCIFTVDGEEKNLKAGEIWEVNNDKLMHSVKNDGDEDRIHLIIDWCEKPLQV